MSVKITVVGIGYVGLSIAMLLAQRNDVIALDVDPDRVALVNARKSPIRNAEIEAFLETEALRLKATTDAATGLRDADFVVIATPTSYDPKTSYLDTSTVEEVARKALAQAPQALIVIRSTVPVGYTAALCARLGSDRIIVSPEFLRESTALHDSLYPSRIVIGGNRAAARQFAALLQHGARDPDVPVLFTDASEAEAIKLFSNAFLALRVAYFNELDSYAMAQGLDPRAVIDGVCLDPRIGRHYNNPSFGYGGYCLPKDTRQLLANFGGIPQKLITAVIDANATRKDIIAEHVLARNPRVVGVYRLAMKAGGDNWRDSSVHDIIHRLQEAGVRIVVYEPHLKTGLFMGARVLDDLSEFKSGVDIILANRKDDALADVADKVFTRDIFGAN